KPVLGRLPIGRETGTIRLGEGFRGSSSSLSAQIDWTTQMLEPGQHECIGPGFQKEHAIMMKSMTTLLAGTVVAATMVAAAPASAQSITIGPDGPGIDLRSRGQRERDYRREMRMRDR